MIKYTCIYLFVKYLLSLQSKACWPYYGMGVQDAWSLGFTGLDIRVAVVDVGVEMNHPDLERNIVNFCIFNINNCQFENKYEK